MRTIWKYQILPVRNHAVPLGGKVLSAGYDGEGQPSVWIEVAAHAGTEQRCFQAIGTGHHVPNGSTFIGTIRDDVFIWHIYEVPAL